jgi:putative drug exporter of the RND superfamily
VGETLIAILAATTNVPRSASALAAMVGLGVGLDYSLFIVTRFREARHAGSSVVDAASQASATAGYAVLFGRSADSAMHVRRG